MAVTSGVTVKVPPLLTTPEIVTETGPVEAPTGTGATMLPSLQLVAAAGIPLKLTVLLPWIAPNPFPLTVTAVPTGPAAGENPVMEARTLKLTEFEFCPETDTTTGPVVAPVGTGVTMLVFDHEVGVAAVPLNVTLLDPWEDPNAPPEIVTLDPSPPIVGETLDIKGNSTSGRVTCES